jgi:hypothetical protein
MKIEYQMTNYRMKSNQLVNITPAVIAHKRSAKHKRLDTLFLTPPPSLVHVAILDNIVTGNRLHFELNEKSFILFLFCCSKNCLK